MKIAILVSKYTPNASIVTCFQIFRHEKYPIASVYLKFLFFYIKHGNFEKKAKILSKYTLKSTKLDCFKIFSGEHVLEPSKQCA